MSAGGGIGYCAPEAVQIRSLENDGRSQKAALAALSSSIRDISLSAGLPAGREDSNIRMVESKSR